MAIKVINREYCPYLGDMQYEYICDTDADFASLPKCCTGSTALSIQSGKVQMVNTQGEWVAFAE